MTAPSPDQPHRLRGCAGDGRSARTRSADASLTGWLRLAAVVRVAIPSDVGTASGRVGIARTRRTAGLLVADVGRAHDLARNARALRRARAWVGRIGAV